MVELDQLRNLSARVGSNPLLVQAAGGNTSLKVSEIIWIKASGTWLKDANARDIFVPLDHAAILNSLRHNDPSCETCADFIRSDLNATGLRPSIETTVHALMPQRVVLHVHCVNTIAWAIREDAKARLSERLRDFAWMFIPYARPGLPLANAIASNQQPGVDVLILGNHGLVVAADTVQAAESLLDSVVTALSRPVRDAVKPNRAALARRCEGTAYSPAVQDETHALATDRLALIRSQSCVFYPDHVVFLGVGVATSFDRNSPLVAVPGEGVFIHNEAKAAIEPMGRCLADVMRRVEDSDPLVALTDTDVDRLVNWDAEKYRQTLKL